MIISKLKAKYIQIKRNLQLYINPTCYVSLGENCLTYNILQRHGLKSFSTIYSHGRSNLDYALQLEQENYKNLLEPSYLYYDYVDKTQVVRNSYYAKSSQIYHKLHQNGFEFTHHNIIDNQKAKESALRKLERLSKLKNKKHFKFFYHYRLNEKLSLDQIIVKAKKFNSFYSSSSKNSEIIIFTQQIVKTTAERRLEKLNIQERDVSVYKLHTTKVWEGTNNDIFWARVDDDLIKTMFKAIESHG